MTFMDRAAELALVERLRGAKPGAFDEIYAAYNLRLFNFLARLSRRPDVAEDLLEETWVRVIEHAGRLRPDTRLAPWLFTVARNLYFSYCRTRALDDGLTASIGLWPLAMPHPSPYEATAANELERRVETALASLPRVYREVLLLVWVEGLTPAEAALVCGIRADALRQRLSRGRALLAEELRRADEPGIAVLGEVLP
jgi:RNA polymerase sigma-70 factor (ECF subfamily)